VFDIFFQQGVFLSLGNRKSYKGQKLAKKKGEKARQPFSV
jgi:hypothetical protein